MTTGPVPDARRLAVALLRLVETGDATGARLLLDGLEPEQLRAVLLAQTRNLGLLFEAAFAEVVEQRLPAIAEAYGRTRAEVIADYLDLIALRFALGEMSSRP
ncbi:hypothetical protein [Actinomadura sp. NTSP31]|uniref:hypothetical protein n=1 Tax=Actinomadura sp. NTSP31 TaxID=1735447 RepID=UPI0035C1A033